MKKLLFASLTLFALAGNLRAKDRGYIAESNIGPTFANTTGITAATLSAQGAGKYNCLEYVTFYSTSAYTAYILDGNTTSYQVTLPASTLHTTPFTDEYCGSSNAVVTIKSSVTTAGAASQVNYRGFVGR